MEIESGAPPEPTNINVGFPDDGAEEADIERQLIEAEKQGTSIGEIEDRKLAAEQGKPVEDKVTHEGDKDKPKEGVETKPDNSETPAEKEKRELARDDKTGKFVKAESKYEKARKDAERKDKSWKALEAEKAQVRAEAEQQKAELEQRAAQIADERVRMQQEARNRGEFSPQEYHKAAQDWQKAGWKALSEGDAELAKKHFSDANQCMQAAQRTWEYNLVQNRQKDINDTIAKHPELQDINSEAGRAMTRLLNENPYLAQIPNGFSKGAQFLVAQRDAARVSELEGQVKTITKERDDARAQLKAATSLGAAGSQTQPGERNFDDLNDREQEREVERMFNNSGEFVHA